MNEIVFVELLNEGTTVYRPTIANKLRDKVYEILRSNQYDAEAEEWAFAPGSIVVVETKLLDQGEVLVAISKLYD